MARQKPFTSKATSNHSLHRFAQWAYGVWTSGGWAPQEWTAGVRIAGALLGVSLLAFAQPAMKPVRPLSSYQKQQLRHWFGVGAAEIASAESGEAVAIALPSRHPKELAVAGVVWIGGPLKGFLDGQRELLERHGNGSVRAAEIFGQPPQLADLASLHLDDRDLSDLARCRPADCGLKLFAQDLAYLQRLDGQSRLNPESWNRRFRNALLNRLVAYQATGNLALGDFADKPSSTVGADEFQALLANSPYLTHLAGDLHQHLANYPAQKSASAEDIFYWSNVQFGLKPTVRLNHLVIFRNSNEEFPWVIASKQILATHYFQAALELRMALLPPGSDGHDGFYLVTVNRSRNDGIDGSWARLFRQVIHGKAVDGVARYLTFVRSQAQPPPLEAHNLMRPNPNP